MKTYERVEIAPPFLTSALDGGESVYYLDWQERFTPNRFQFNIHLVIRPSDAA
jgi:hypothetical protein